MTSVRDGLFLTAELSGIRGAADEDVRAPGRRTLEAHSLTTQRMHEADAVGVEAHGCGGGIERLGVTFGSAGEIDGISDDGMADTLHMNANLVGSTGV